MFFPRKDYFSHCQYSLVSFSSLCRVGNAWISPAHITASIVILVHFMFRLSCWWDFWYIFSDVSRRQSLTENFLFLWILLFFCPFLQCPMSNGCKSCVLDVSTRTEFYNYEFSFIVYFSNGLCQLKDEVSFMLSEDYTCPWV